jgi:tetratricopeptide (TPR) repeat protein
MVDDYVNSIAELYELHDYKGCIIQANSIVLDIQSLPPRLNQIVGNSYFFEEDYGNAIERYCVAISQSEDLTKDDIFELFFFLGKSYYFLHSYESSYMCLSVANKMKPDQDIVLYFISCVFYKVEDFDRSITYIDKTIDLNPFDPIYHNKRAWICFKNNDFQNTIKSCNRVIQLDPNNLNAYCLKADSQMISSDYNGALVSYTNAIHLDSLYPNLFLYRGIVKDNLDDMEGALDDFAYALKLPCDDLLKSDIYDNIGLIYLKTGVFDLALKNQNMAIINNNSNSQMFLNRGITKANIPDYLGAIEDLKKAIELDQMNIGSYDVLSQVYEKIRNYKEAKKYFSLYLYFSKLKKSQES